jgi:hypothetical protein
MLIVKFAIRESNVVWIVNDNWVILISFLLTVITGLIYKRLKKSTKIIKVPNQKGGASFIDDCIELDSVYELVDRPLEIVLKRMLNLPPEAGPLIVSAPLFIFAYFVSRQPMAQITILGINFMFDKYKSLALKTAIGILSGSIFLMVPIGIVSIGLISLTTTLLTGVMIFNIFQGLGHFECNNLVSKVPMERISQERTAAFLDIPPEKTPKVFIKGKEDIDIYIPIYNKDDSCSSKFTENVKKSNVERAQTKTTTQIQGQILRKCRKSYTPLKHRTKTLADLKKEDSTENREKASISIDRYEKRRIRIQEQRMDKKGGINNKVSKISDRTDNDYDKSFNL